MLVSQFEPDRTFESIHNAYSFLREEYCLELPTTRWRRAESGIDVPEPFPRYLFRGECGDFPTTMPASHRPDTYRLRNARRLDPADEVRLTDLIADLATRFTQRDYSLGEDESIGLLHHYGLPTDRIDFTCHPGKALAFATARDAAIGRICVLPACQASRHLDIVNLMDHRWCERPRRQDAFAIAWPRRPLDLKNREVRSALGARWYEFPLEHPANEFLREKHDDLVRLDDDPSAGFLRFHITEYVEGRGKLSPLLTEWLLERVPMMPRCAEVREFDGGEVVIRFRPPRDAGPLDQIVERSCTQRCWSREFSDSSWDRMKGWTCPPVGSVFADPRTLHTGA